MILANLSTTFNDCRYEFKVKQHVSIETRNTDWQIKKYDLFSLKGEQFFFWLQQSSKKD